MWGEAWKRDRRLVDKSNKLLVINDWGKKEVWGILNWGELELLDLLGWIEMEALRQLVEVSSVGLGRILTPY